MIYAEYVEFDMPTGERMRRLEAYGHAGYAPAGQDIVCAGASMLMETLVYMLAGCEEADCCAYREPTGPRVSVKLTGNICESDLAAIEFAKNGLALLAERCPDHVHFVDKSKDGQEKIRCAGRCCGHRAGQVQQRRFQLTGAGGILRRSGRCRTGGPAAAQGAGAHDGAGGDAGFGSGLALSVA